MRIPRAIVTAAAPAQRDLPLQSLALADGRRRSILQIQVAEARSAGCEEVAVVIAPGMRAAYEAAAGELRPAPTFVEQAGPRGYAQALLAAREFSAGEPFLHLVGDHVWVAREARTCARQLVELAAAENCAVSAVQPTRERALASFGAVGGRPVANRTDLHQVEKVLEKPTPTEAEQELATSGLRAGQYLCFFGMHVLGPSVWPALESAARARAAQPASLSHALAELCRSERVLAYQPRGARYDLGAPLGLVWAGLALALAGAEREEVLASLVELLAERDPRRSATAD